MKCDSEWSIFVKNDNVDGCVYFALFVNDGMIMGRNASELDEIVRSLMSEFQVKVGPAEVFVRMEI